MNKITPKEFRELGYLMELNRRFLHPIGMALEVVRSESGEERFGDVCDARYDPEGFVYSDDDINLVDKNKAEEFNRLIEDKHEARMKSLGYVVQTLKG